MFQDNPYRSYVYAYPHKTAYRRLAPPQPLAEIWAAEPRDALFLYVHIPFCQMRCGFCNLFTVANTPGNLTGAYLSTLERQMEQVSQALGEVTIATVAVGGGTPTYLTADELERLFSHTRTVFKVEGVPTSVETSPKPPPLNASPGCGIWVSHA